MKKEQISKEDKLFIKFKENDDQKSFIELFKKTDSWLFRMILKLVGDRAKADDILQETWYKAIKNKENFDPGKGKFNNYIYKIAKNEVLQFLRHKDRSRVIFDNTFDLVINPDRIQEMQELGNIIRDTIANMDNPNIQDALMMFYFADMRVEEIANSMDTKEHNVKNWLSRGRAELEKELRKHKEFISIYNTISKII